jgi:hypothetical protein
VPAGRSLPNQRLREVGAVAGETTGERDIRPDCSDQSLDKLAAVNVQTVGKHEDTGQIFSTQSSTDGLSAMAGLLRIGNVVAD